MIMWCCSPDRCWAIGTSANTTSGVNFEDPESARLVSMWRNIFWFIKKIVKARVVCQYRSWIFTKIATCVDSGCNSASGGLRCVWPKLMSYPRFLQIHNLALTFYFSFRCPYFWRNKDVTCAVPHQFKTSNECLDAVLDLRTSIFPSPITLLNLEGSSSRKARFDVTCPRSLLIKSMTVDSVRRVRSTWYSFCRSPTSVSVCGTTPLKREKRGSYLHDTKTL